MSVESSIRSSIPVWRPSFFSSLRCCRVRASALAALFFVSWIVDAHVSSFLRMISSVLTIGSRRKGFSIKTLVYIRRGHVRGWHYERITSRVINLGLIHILGHSYKRGACGVTPSVLPNAHNCVWALLYASSHPRAICGPSFSLLLINTENARNTLLLWTHRHRGTRGSLTFSFPDRSSSPEATDAAPPAIYPTLYSTILFIDKDPTIKLNHYNWVHLHGNYQRNKTQADIYNGWCIACSFVANIREQTEA